MANYEWSPASLKERHFLAATLYACGYHMNDISSAVTLSVQHLTALFRSPLFQAEVKRIRERVQVNFVDQAVTHLQQEANASVATLVSIRDNDTLSPTVRLRAAESVLDRLSRTSKAQRLEHTAPAPPVFTDEQVQTLMQTLNDDPLARRAFDHAANGALDLIDIEAPQPKAESVAVEVN